MDGERYYCPCCGYRGPHEPAYSEMPPTPFGNLGDPPYIGRFGWASFECCDCCGFEFGYDDDPGASGRACSFGQYRAERVSQQMVWFRSDRRLGVWSLAEQLRAAGIPPKTQDQTLHQTLPHRLFPDHGSPWRAC